jgi:hypothetical protein
MLVYKKNKSTIHLHVIPVLKWGCVFWEFAKRKLATQKDNQDEKRRLRNLLVARVVSREERCEVLACFHVVVKMYRYSLEEWVFIVKTYWITGSIKNCQRRFVEQFGGQNPPSKSCIQLLVKKLETKVTWRREARNVGKYRGSSNTAGGFSVPHCGRLVWWSGHLVWWRLYLQGI